VPWTLDIHTLDVGAGEASLIIAFNPDVPGSSPRSILIDGGLSAVAPIVHDAVTRLLPPGTGPDVILVTHYDKDHSGGVTDLMYADNLTAVVEEIAEVAEFYSGEPINKNNAPWLARRVACAALGAMLGSWGPYARAVEDTVLDIGPGPATEKFTTAADVGVAAALKEGNKSPFGTTSLFEAKQTAKRAAAAAGIAAGKALIKGKDVLSAIRTALFVNLQNCVPPLARFQTGGIYSDVQIIDIGKDGSPIGKYVPAIEGKLFSGAMTGAVMPGIARRRTDLPPPLGMELFWQGAAPPAADAPHAEAPYAVVVSRSHNKTAGLVWQGEGVKPQTVSAGKKENQQSIGLVIRFNDFFFFTAGDMPTLGEDLLSAALVNYPLPDGAGGLLPNPAPPPPVVAFKCGHHGADTCTSAKMLQDLTPFTAHISCGEMYGHPFPSTLQRLYDAGTSIYLTNCRYNRRPLVAASPEQDGGPPPATHGPGKVNQWLLGSRARIAGDNAVDNLDADRLRGDIQISVQEQYSFGDDRFYTTTFLDNYPEPPARPGILSTVIQDW
jgi:beta-lactamase superfamily II metal-dependent hydrolase